MTIYKSRQVNLDPEPYRGMRARYSREEWGALGNDPTVWLKPRPEFEPTRDPAPWERLASYDHDHLVVSRHATKEDEFCYWKPRREQFDTPVNPILAEVRRGIDPITMLDNLGNADYMWEVEQDGVWTPEQIDHAWRVLTRLAALA